MNGHPYQPSVCSVVKFFVFLPCNYFTIEVPEVAPVFGGGPEEDVTFDEDAVFVDGG